MSAPSSTRRKRRRRGVTRRVRDSKGNIVVKKYTKKTSSFSAPSFLKFHRLPTTIIGSAFLFYAYAASNYKSARQNNQTPTFDLGFLQTIYDDPASRFLYMGIGAIGIAAMMGWALISVGIKVKKWSSSWRQLFAVWMTIIVLSAVVSPFFNEPGLIRQQDDDEFVINDGTFDLSGLDSPFYSELLNGLLDLLGNIPQPDERVAVVEKPGGGIFDEANDRYLYRWRIAETYDTDIYDFEEGFPNFQTDYLQFNPNTNDQVDESGSTIYSVDPTREIQQLRIAEQYLTLTSSYSGQALVPWNSEYGALIGDPTTMTADLLNEGSLISGNKEASFRDINEQPVLSATFSQPRTQGFLGYDSWWVAEDKDTISQQSLTMNQLASALGNYDTNRFGDLSTISPSFGISDVWGSSSLPIGYSTQGGAGQDFQDAFNAFQADIDTNTSVYTTALKVATAVQNALLQALLTQGLNIDPATAQSVADDNSDKAYWFWTAIKPGSTTEFGMKELLAGFVNMLRALGIPARPVIGFSVGDYSKSTGTFDENNKEILNECSGDCDAIELRFEHVHVWIEALIPTGNPSNPGMHWGIFNPIPDPIILADSGFTDFEYGRNSLGGSPTVEIDLNSGETQSLGTTLDLGGVQTDSFQFMQMGENITGGVRVVYEDGPATGIPITLKYVTLADLNSAANLDPTAFGNIGVDLSPVTTSGPDGWANFTLFVDRQGFIHEYNDTAPIDPPLNPLSPIQNLDPTTLADPNTMALYGFMAVVSLVVDISLMAFRFNATLNLEILNAPSSQIISPLDGSTISAFGVQIGSIIDVQLTALNDEGDPIDELLDVDLLLLSENEAVSLSNAVTIADLTAIQNIIDTSTVEVFATTDINGQSIVTLDFNQNTSPTGFDYSTKISAQNVYVLVAVYELQSFTNPPVNMWYSSDMVLTASVDTGVHSDTPLPVLNTGDPSQTWTVNVSATAYGLNPVFPSEPGINVNLKYYVIDDAAFTGNPTYAGISTFLGNCATESGCILVSTTNPEVNFTGDIQTNNLGQASFDISLSQSAFTVGLWYIIIVADTYNTFIAANVTGFYVTSPPVPLFLTFNQLDKNPIQNFETSNQSSDQSSDQYDASYLSQKSILMIILSFLYVSTQIVRRKRIV